MSPGILAELRDAQRRSFLDTGSLNFSMVVQRQDVLDLIDVLREERIYFTRMDNGRSLQFENIIVRWE